MTNMATSYLTTPHLMQLIATVIFIAIAAYGLGRTHAKPMRGKRLRVFRHNKTGTHYVVLYCGRLESSTAPCVIYTAVAELDDPQPWVREYNEFFDGRFTQIGYINYDLNSGKSVDHP